MTGGVIVLADQRSGISEESVCTSRDDDTLCVTLLTGRAADKRNETKTDWTKAKKEDSREVLIAKLLVLWEGFTSESGLIDRHVDCLAKTGNCKDNFKRDHVSGNQTHGFNFSPSSGAPVVQVLIDFLAEGGGDTVGCDGGIRRWGRRPRNFLSAGIAGSFRGSHRGNEGELFLKERLVP